MKRHQLLKMEMPKLRLLLAGLAIFSSTSCSTQADHCTRHDDCFNAGTCVNGTSNYSCVCAPGFIGNYCEVNIADCAGHSRCMNGGTCVDGTNGFNCLCAEAFLGDLCEHPNECVYPGTCASVGKSAKCKCREGYASDPHDSRRCEPVDKNLNKNATLVFASGGYKGGIEQFSLSQQTVTRIQNHSPMGNALDVLYRTNTIYWSDSDGIIYTGPIRQGAAQTVVLNASKYGVLYLAVDWVYGHLYFAEELNGTISVTNTDGSMKKDLFTTRVTSTTAIAVDPLSGWIYWVDSLSKNIERAAMDGSQGEIIANTEPKFPQGLALDITQNRLYWTENEFNVFASIHSMNVDGSDQKLVYLATKPTFANGWFYSITTLEDFVYWRDIHTHSVYRTSKCGGGKAEEIYSTAENWDAFYTLQAYHYSKQPESVNYCENRIGGHCSHLCFRIPSTGNETVATNCACPDGLTLSFDQRTCT